MPEAIQSVTPIVVPWSLPLAFGLYPANRAAAMNPIEALLHVA